MLILASASPRRQELLRSAGIPFEARPADIDETRRDGETAREYVLRLAEAKARAAATPGETVLGADTVVVVDDRILGKPADRDEAGAMLRLLSGRTHRVMTAVCLLRSDECRTFVETTSVRFRELGESEIQAYVNSGDPLDKAGAYGIQGGAGHFVERIDGCWFNAVGLPLTRLQGLPPSCFERFPGESGGQSE